MPDSTSNQKRTIATKGSDHTAMALAPDVCKLPSGLPLPFPNHVPTTKLTANATNNTFIGNKPITLDRTHVGPPSDPAHAGVAGGIISGTYRFEAQAATYSRDVFAESGAVVRSFDLTTQNHKNTMGMMLSGMYLAKLEAQEREAKKKCVIDKFEGECGHGRKLGWPGEPGEAGKEWYLEVLENDTITFKTERKDVTKKPHETNPECPKGTHTGWYAEAIKFPNPAMTKARKPEGGQEKTETFKVEAAMAIEDWIMFFLGYDRGGGPGHTLADEGTLQDGTKWSEKPTRKGKQQEALDGLPSGASPKAKADALKQANRDFNDYERANGEMAKANPTWSETKVDKKALAISVREALLLWLWYMGAPQIDVKAFACGGSRSARLKVFPKKEFKFEFVLEKTKAGREKTKKQKERAANAKAKDRAAADKARSAAIAKHDGAEKHFQMIRAGLVGIKSVFDLANTIQDAAGDLVGSKLKLEFCKAFKIELVFQYKEATELKGRFEKRKQTPATVGRTWELFVGADPLIGINGRIVFPLLNLAFPGIGYLARRVIKLEIYFSATVELGVGVFVGRDEYDYCTKAGGRIKGDFKFAAGLAFGIGRWKVIDVRITFNPGFVGEIVIWKDPECLIGAKFNAYINTHVKVTLNPDSYWWRKELVDYHPPWAQWKYGPKNKTLLKAPQ